MMLGKGFIFTIITAVAWAIQIVIARGVLSGGLNAYTVALWTELFALPYWLLIAWRKKRLIKKLKKSDFAILLAMGLISTFGVGITEVFALKYTPAPTYSFLIRFIVVFTIFFAAVFLKEKITKKKVILVTMIMSGAYFLTVRGGIPVITIGAVFTLAEAALIAFGNNVLGKISTNRMDANLAASGMYLVGLLPTAVLAFANNATLFPPGTLLWLLAITACSLILTTTRFQAYRHASASYVTMIMSFTPVFVSILAFFFLRESLSPIQLAGGFLIVLAGIFVEKLKI